MMRSRLVWIALFFSVCLLSAGTAGFAQDPPWMPPPPSKGEKDWIRLSSLEWLRGDIKLMRDDEFEFDSEEMDEHTFDWVDVIEIRSPRILTYTFLDSRIYTGTATMRDSVITILVDGQPRTFHRDLLISIIEGDLSEINFWSAKASIGLIARSGNTNQQDMNSLVLIRRQATRSRLDLQYIGNFSEVSEQQTVNNHLGSLRLDYLLTKGFFITPATASAYSDKFQNIELRWSAAAGVGVDLIRKGNIDWYIGLGGGYQETRFVSVLEGEPDKDASGVAVPSITYEMDITSDLDLTFNYDAQVTIPDTENTIHHGFALLSYELTSIFDFDISTDWNRVENPRPNSDGDVPAQNDWKFSFGLGVDL